MRAPLAHARDSTSRIFLSRRAQVLSASFAAVQVRDEEELCASSGELIASPDRRWEIVTRPQQVIALSTGAAERTVDAVLDFLSSHLKHA